MVLPAIRNDMGYSLNTNFQSVTESVLDRRAENEFYTPPL